jgi:hypothetical protein
MCVVKTNNNSINLLKCLTAAKSQLQATTEERKYTKNKILEIK